MNLSGVIFDLDGTLADTAELRDGRRTPWDVLSIADTNGPATLTFKYNGVDVGLGQILAELLQHGIPVGVVSRSPSSYASTLLWLLGYDFLIFRAGGVGVSQEERIRQICNDLSIDISSALYVGDTEDDMHAAKALGCHFASPFWNPKSISANNFWYSWHEITPKDYPTDISPTLRHLIGVLLSRQRILPDYRIDVVVTRILKGRVSITDLYWLESSPFKYWEELAKQMVKWPSTGMSIDDTSAGLNGEDAAFDRMEGILKSGDWGRIFTLKLEEVVWYLNKFPESASRAVFAADRYASMVNESILSAFIAAGFVQAKPHEHVLTLPLIVRWALQQIGVTEIDSDAKKILHRYREVPWEDRANQEYILANLVGLRAPASNAQYENSHSSLISQLDNEFNEWLFPTEILLRNRYEFEQMYLRDLFEDLSRFPEPVSVDNEYQELTSVSKGFGKIKAFLPYRSAGNLCGQAFWWPIKDWSRGWQSGPEVHLHYLEQIALVMAKHLAVTDPLGKRPLLGMPPHHPTAEKPAAASMRLVKRIGEILDRDVYWPILRVAEGFSVNEVVPIERLHSGVFIDDQLTSGRTYQSACDVLGFSPDLLVWSCSRLVTRREA